jgi:hypothetical protein
MENIFEKATKDRLRFNSGKGELSVEDLWELKLTDLDNIAKAVNKKLKEDDSEDSFIGKRPNKSKNELTLKLEILKSIIATKLEESEKAKVKGEKRAQKEFLSDLLQKKRINALESMPVEDIEKQLASLEEVEEG